MPRQQSIASPFIDRDSHRALASEGMLPFEWIEKIIKIDTVTHGSNEAILPFLLPLLEETGLTVRTQKVVENGVPFFNLIAHSHSPNAPDLLALNTHLDTVSTGPLEKWTRTKGDPFTVHRVRDRLYGLGTADVKIDFLCKLQAARLAKPWNRPFVLVGTYGEERGLVGITQIFKEKLIQPRYALVGEPSNLELIYAHKGHLIFTLSCPLKGKRSGTNHPATLKAWKGKAAHSSTPHLGVNALRKGLSEIRKRGMGLVALTGGTDSNRIPDTAEAELIPFQTEGTKRLFSLLEDLDDWERELRKRKDARFSPSHNTLSLNLAKMSGENVHLTFDIRIIPGTTGERLLRTLEEIAEKHQLAIESYSLDAPLKGSRTSRFMEQAADSLRATGTKVVRKTKASSTEAAVYSENGAEAIVFGPGISVGNVHKPNEHNSLRQIQKALEFYTEMLKRPVGGGRS